MAAAVAVGDNENKKEKGGGFTIAFLFFMPFIVNEIHLTKQFS